jgi:hypothetical protein
VVNYIEKADYKSLQIRHEKNNYSVGRFVLSATAKCHIELSQMDRSLFGRRLNESKFYEY